ncbi:hypothetical protein PT285_10340 [Lactobacillus sp. ESL0791]|uniref:PTS sugar transporter subunit IIA domain-containing protein n=1 Tax=Lactobacillus sp. ESL0791 TaxID=2983234 RepID=UPI0023F9712E|nr:hypothetical protein [Lactobacillus sp. ESL0791]MDF7639798.1 hypothetical protein [Lactobacillus sp. ESL0791]
MNVTIVILCHGTWGKSLVRDYQTYFGSSCQFKVFPLEAETEKKMYKDKVDNYIKNNPNSILICDLFGSTTFQTALKIALNKKLPAYSNLSLELLISLTNIISDNTEFSEIKRLLRTDKEIKNKDLVTLYKKYMNGDS